MKGHLFRTLRKNKRNAAVVLTLVIGSIVFGAFRLTMSAPQVPTAEVKREEFVSYVEVNGEIRAARSKTLIAPHGAGDLLIVKLATNGAHVKRGDVLVQFDDTSIKQKLEQDRSGLKSAEASIQQARAESSLKVEQDRTDLMKAKYDVERARMDAGKQEILSVIEGEEAKLKLADAEQSLKQAESKLKADQSAGDSKTVGEQKKRDLIAEQVQQDERNLENLVLRAPTDGLLNILVNWRNARGPSSILPFRTGDRAWPGADIGEVPDLSSLRFTGRIDESERGQVQLQLPATVRVDAIPDRNFGGRVDDISTTASIDWNSGFPPVRNFTVDVNLENTDQRLTPGMKANMRVAVNRVASALVMPSDALFVKGGRTLAYVKDGARFAEKTVEVSKRSGGQVLVSRGLAAGDLVALKDPTAAK
jgi:multidrug efflux pump subunit AcrA (membrane-fusion protein)